ncbi:hypothetical protein [Burkholderia sp. WSM2230]|uniref:hypothetical protein n=1 Tax=Burkholderia sp. WSM2230 TaxID=944435 RepID=UPI0005546F29|nr:hypothetical protein [Burkholderia sp. WSM2230]
MLGKAVRIGIFPGLISFVSSPYQTGWRAVIEVIAGAAPQRAQQHYGVEDSEMEKWLVVLGIWAMCAACAVLFIRGATGKSGKREASEARGSTGEARAALHE